MRLRVTAVILPLLAACTPYTYGATAHTAPKGETRRNGILTVVPNGYETRGGDGRKQHIAIPSFDAEWRWGIDDRTDLGARVNSLSGVIVSWKRRVAGASDGTTPATALTVGGGFVNLGNHAHAELTLVTSGRETRTVTPYGGVRAIQIAPLSTTAPHDTPAVGAFGGVRIGGTGGSFSLELGVFHDRSALGMRRGSVVVAPAVVVHRLGRVRLLDPW